MVRAAVLVVVLVLMQALQARKPRDQLDPQDHGTSGGLRPREPGPLEIDLPELIGGTGRL